MSRPAKLTLAFLVAALLVGLSATQYLLFSAEPSALLFEPLTIATAVLVAMVTAGNLMGRYVRWHYVLRRVGARLEMVPNLGAFGASFLVLPVPLYLGQAFARARLVPDLPPKRRGHIVLAFLWERLLDVWALAVLATPVLPGWIGGLVLAFTIAGFTVGFRTWLLERAIALTEWASQLLFDEPVELAREDAEATIVGETVLVGAVLSLGVWLATALSIIPLALAFALPLDPAALIGAAASSILAGALSLVPLGAGVAGAILIDQLEGFGATAVVAAELTFVFRIATVWLTVGLGAVSMYLHRARTVREHAHDHFDSIDECYDAWLPEHYRQHLIGKKIGPMLGELSTLPAGARGLDIGCGRGWYMQDMVDRGFDMYGVDLSMRQLVAAKDYLQRPRPIAQGSVLDIPVKTASFDFAYIVNVLHHMPTPHHQELALSEMARAIKPGGRIFVHEMNVINPLFRFYLAYVFPILKGIEEGFEPYMDTRVMPQVPGLELKEVKYFTFAPDFIPAAMIPVMTPIENWLETTRAAPYAAHFLAIFERVEDRRIDSDVPGSSTSQVGLAG